MKNKILIADDNKEKLSNIEEFLKGEFQDINMDFAFSYNSTTKKLKSGDYELLILDMSMPTFDLNDKGSTGVVRPLAGKDIMGKLQYREVNIPVIIITQFDVFGRHSDTVDLNDLIDDLYSSFPENFKGCVFYDPSSNQWCHDLSSKIKEVIGE
jgi:CheY-like chemotaxis protein